MFWNNRQLIRSCSYLLVLERDLKNWRLSSLLVTQKKCKLTSHRLGVQIKQTSIGVVQTNCFRFLAWRIVRRSFLDVFYPKYAASNLALPKYASLNWSFTAWKHSIVSCASQRKTTKTQICNCKMRKRPQRGQNVLQENFVYFYINLSWSYRQKQEV